MLLITDVINIIIIKNLSILAYLFLLIYSIFSFILLTILSTILLFIFLIIIFLASDTVWSLGYTIYYLSAIKREEKKEKAIYNYLIKCIGASLVLLSSPSHTRGAYI